MENCENHAQNDTPVDTPSIPRALARVANVRPSAFAYEFARRYRGLRRKFVGHAWSPRRGFTGHFPNSHGVAARAL